MEKFNDLQKTFYSIINLLNQYKIEYWIDWGTALGYERINSIIPWDYDVDICMLEDDFNNLNELFKKTNYQLNNIIYNQNYYNDNGCCFIYLKDLTNKYDINDIVGIDVVKYTKKHNKLITLMNTNTILEYSNPNQDVELYNFNYDDIFPLQTKLMYGIPVFVPNKNIQLLIQKYGENCIEKYSHLDEYNIWINNINNNLISQLLLKKPFLNIKKFNTIDEGLTFFNETKQPFIVNNPIEFKNITTNIVKQNMINEPEQIFSYDNNFNIKYNSGQDIINLWENDNLKTNVVDSYASNFEFFPSFIKNDAKLLNKYKQTAFCYIATKANNFTKFHIDPDFGNGWMYLTEGIKIWYIINKEDTEYILNNGYTIEDIEQMKFFDIIKILNYYLWNKIYVGILQPNDFLYWHINNLHSVITYDKSIGICGYHQNISNEEDFI